MKEKRTVMYLFSILACVMLILPASALANTSELVGLLTSQLGVSEQQAEGGAGALFQVAKKNLSKDNFGKIASYVPDMDTLLKAAPALAKLKGVGNLASSLGGDSKGVDMAGLPAIFGKLGMDGGMVAKFMPIILSFVQSKGGDSVMELLKGVWK